MRRRSFIAGLTATSAWLITLFGTIVAPLFEEICFRGFLLPAFAIAYDWLSLSRTEQARVHWQTTTSITRPALAFSAILTSICFAMLHFEQVAHLWAATLVLFCISLILTVVHGFSCKEAAAVLGVPLGTLLSRLHRGRKQLERGLWEYAVAHGLVTATEEP